MLLCILGIVIILFILCLILFAKKFSKHWAALLEVLPSLVSNCENLGIVGSENKLNYVLDLAINYLAAISGFKVSYIRDKFAELIKIQIEQILSAPHKKEVN